ncbi:hypothetical protein ACWD00_04040 [Streptomyces viridiviolaceus]
MLYGIAAATASFLLAALFTAVLGALALRLALVDRRRQRPVPLIGGLAVVLVTGLVAGVGGWTGVVPLGSWAGRLLVAGVAVGALGLAADVWRLRRRWVVVGTAVAAACVVPYEETGPFAGALAVGWIALVAAAFRGLDHADGVAGTVGVVTAFGVGLCAAAEVMDGVAVLLSVLAAALTGFLLHNWHPARIALGASGALFAGFVLAGAAVFTRAAHEPGASAGVLFALTAIVTADAVLVLLSRRLAGRPVLRGGPDHLTHRLRRLGLTSQGAAVVIGAGAFAGVLTGVLSHTGWASGSAVLWLAGTVVVAVLGLLRVRVYEPRPGASVPGREPGRTGSAPVRRPRGAESGAARVPRRTARAVVRGPRRAPEASVSGRRREADAPVRRPRRAVDSPVREPRRTAGGRAHEPAWTPDLSAYEPRWSVQGPLVRDPQWAPPDPPAYEPGWALLDLPAYEPGWALLNPPAYELPSTAPKPRVDQPRWSPPDPPEREPRRTPSGPSAHLYGRALPDPPTHEPRRMPPDPPVHEPRWSPPDPPEHEPHWTPPNPPLREPRRASDLAARASGSAANFPVRQANRTESSQVRAPLRVRNG